MRIFCLHGYFIFEERRAGDASDFMSLFGIDLVRKGHFFVFKDLEDAPEFSLAGKPYLSGTAIKTFAGQPWEIFQANEFVYNYDKGQIVPIDSITQSVDYEQSGNVFVSPGLILPGSLTAEGERVTDYAAWFYPDSLQFKYSEVTLD